MHVSFIFKDNCHQNVYHHDILIVACACKQSLILHCLNKLNVTMNIKRSKSEGAIISLGVSEVCVYSCWCNTLTSYSVYNHRQLSSLFDNLLRSTETKRKSSTLLTNDDVIMQFIGLDFSNSIFTPRTSNPLNYSFLVINAHVPLDYSLFNINIYVAWWRHQMETFSALLAMRAFIEPVHRNKPNINHLELSQLLSTILLTSGRWHIYF